MLGHLQSAVPGQRATQRRRKLLHVLAQSGHHRSGVLACYLHQHAEARTTLHQRDHVTVARPAQQIALPMTGNGAIFDFCWPLTNRDRIDDAALRVPVNAGVPRAADPPLGSQMPHQLLFQRAARLNEKADVDR